MRHPIHLALMLCLSGWIHGGSPGRLLAQTTSPVSFGQDVRPILSDKCYLCHGPDEQGRQADLRLDRREDALYVLSPEAAEDSELVRRIRSREPDEQMPPPTSKLQLTSDEQQVLQRWIEAGSPYEKHWSLRPVKPVALPVVQRRDWPRNAIDYFVLERMERLRLAPSAEASRERLIRRLSFDLTGLPPTVDEIDRFLADHSAAAYERLVDRLLERQQFGERMATDWLDLSRYSDSFGYQVDRERFVWPWRDWVIDAFNRNMPYDQFVLWQLAGDLLPKTTDDQVLATTFNRLHPQKVEGGSIPEEFRVEYVADRTNTFGTAFLGLTLECARCHDHKYDPITQREYYQLFAFFNNIDEAGLYSYFTSSVPTPTLMLVDESLRGKIQDGERAIREMEVDLQACAERQTDAFTSWLRQRPAKPTIPGQIAHLTFEQPPKEPNTQVPGRFGQAVQLTGDDGIALQVGNFQRCQPFAISLWINTPGVKERAVVFHRSRAWTDAGSRGYELLIEQGHLSAALVHFWPGNAIRIRTLDPLPTDQWLHVAVTYDGSSQAKGLHLYLNGVPAKCQTVRDQLTKNITGGGGDQITIGERFRDRGFEQGRLDDFRVYDRQLTEIEVAQLCDQQALVEALKRPIRELSSQQRQQLLAYYLATANGEYQQTVQQLRDRREQHNKTVDVTPEIMVMRELPQRRPSYLLKRGAYDARDQRVDVDTPAALPPFPDGQSRDRLGLARWLIAPNHPLTPRVAVNRLWQICLGQGLVRTPEDFGSQGQPPTHPDLLDWLAWDFVDHGWNVKRLLKQIVLSATYRQSSACSAEAYERDPQNLLLTRAPRYRLPAEMIRDNALAVSGLLVPKIGGPPARPYELAVSFSPLEPDKGAGLYRRSLYTFWKRNAPAPVMISLDAAKRDVCVVRRERTSSPTQALVLWNDPQLVEAARILGQRLLKKHGDNVAGMIQEMFRALTSRQASVAERELLAELWRTQRNYFEQHPDQAQALLKSGRAPVDATVPIARLAAATMLVSTVMNFDECITKR